MPRFLRASIALFIALHPEFGSKAGTCSNPMTVRSAPQDRPQPFIGLRDNDPVKLAADIFIGRHSKLCGATRKKNICRDNPMGQIRRYFDWIDPAICSGDRDLHGSVREQLNTGESGRNGRRYGFKTDVIYQSVGAIEHTLSTERQVVGSGRQRNGKLMPLPHFGVISVKVRRYDVMVRNVGDRHRVWRRGQDVLSGAIMPLERVIPSSRNLETLRHGEGRLVADVKILLTIFRYRKSSQ